MALPPEWHGSNHQLVCGRVTREIPPTSVLTCKSNVCQATHDMIEQAEEATKNPSPPPAAPETKSKTMPRDEPSHPTCANNPSTPSTWTPDMGRNEARNVATIVTFKLCMRAQHQLCSMSCISRSLASSVAFISQDILLLRHRLIVAHDTCSTRLLGCDHHLHTSHSTIPHSGRSRANPDRPPMETSWTSPQTSRL